MPTDRVDVGPLSNWAEAGSSWRVLAPGVGAPGHTRRLQRLASEACLVARQLQMRSHARANDSPLQRALAAKTHFVSDSAELVVAADLPTALATGWLQPGLRLPARLRFAAAGSAMRGDGAHERRLLSVTLEADGRRQDLLLSGPSPLPEAGDPEAAVASLRARLRRIEGGIVSGPLLAALAMPVDIARLGRDPNDTERRGGEKSLQPGGEKSLQPGGEKSLQPGGAKSLQPGGAKSLQSAEQSVFAQGNSNPRQWEPQQKQDLALSRAAKVLWRSRIGTHAASLAAIAYFSQLPFRLGQFAVQYALVPAASVAPELVGSGGREALLRDLVSRQRCQPLRFRLLLRGYIDEVRTPLGHAWQDWRSPWLQVAELNVPMDAAASEATGLCAIAEQASRARASPFNYWGPGVFEPLGELNALRRAVYRASAMGRGVAEKDREGGSAAE